MKLLCIFAAVLVAVAADSEAESFYGYPDYFEYIPNPRFRRDVTLIDRKVGQNGRVFGTLGSNDNGLFGKGRYEHNIFNDHRGKLDGSLTGTRVLGPYGDSSHLGGALNWKNDRATASLEASKMIHGPTSINAAAGGRWPIGKNGDFSAQGTYSQTSGFGRDYGGMVNYNHRFRRDVTLDRKVGQDGRVFGTLGSNDNGLFGKGGYEQNIFNDHRGKLDGSLTGTRVLGPYGDSSHLGGALNWKNDRATASLEASKMIHGPTSIYAAAGGRWPIGKNGDLSAQGTYSQTSGFGRDYGGMLNYNHRFRRDVTLDRKVGEDGRVFGTLGSNDDGLFGKGGYEQNIFNDNRGKLDGSLTGTRVLGPYGDSSHLGGALNWKNDRATASLEASKMIHGPSSINAAAGGRWPIGKDGDLSAQGFYSQSSGIGRDYGAMLNYNQRW